MNERVVNIRIEPCTVYIGRHKDGKHWGYGNPFVVGVHGNRKEVIEYCREWLLTGNGRGNCYATEKNRRWILDNIEALRGQTLGCFCKPQECHGDIYIELLNAKV